MPASLHDRAMRLEIGVDRPAKILRRNRIRNRADVFFEHAQRVPVAPRDEPFQRKTFQREAKFEQFLDVIAAQRGDDRAAIGQDLHQPFLGEFEQRFANRAAAHAQLPRDVELHDARARLDLPRRDALAEKIGYARCRRDAFHANHPQPRSKKATK